MVTRIEVSNFRSRDDGVDLQLGQAVGLRTRGLRCFGTLDRAVGFLASGTGSAAQVFPLDR